jgi:hypothetical protein
MDANYVRYKRYDDDFKRNAVDLIETSGRPMARKSGTVGLLNNPCFTRIELPVSMFWTYALLSTLRRWF